MPELVFILLIALIVLGPKDMQKAGKTIGTWMNKVVKSSEWREIKDASRNLKTLPNRLMRETNLDEASLNYEQYRHDINIASTEEIEAPYGSWSGISAHKKDEEPKNTAPRVEERLAPVKPASADPEASTAKKFPSIESNDA